MPIIKVIIILAISKTQSNQTFRFNNNNLPKLVRIPFLIKS